MKIKELITFVGTCFGFGSAMILAYTFYNAYFHGMRTLVVINGIGEANIEFIIMPFILIFTGFNFIDFIKRH